MTKSKKKFRKVVEWNFKKLSYLFLGIVLSFFLFILIIAYEHISKFFISMIIGIVLLVCIAYNFQKVEYGDGKLRDVWYEVI